MIKVFGTVDEALKAADRRAYLLGEEGPMRLKKYGGAGHPVEFTTIVKVDKPGGAPEIEEDLILQKVTYPGKELVEKAIAVFRAAYKRFYTEMAVILRWFPPTEGQAGRYAIDRPEFALLSGAHVRHVYRQQRMGVIHSHPTFNGSPSGIDDSNEKDTPGVYMVIGNIDSKTPTITFSICGDGFRLEEDYPFKEFDPKPLTKEEEDWWFENVMTDSAASAKNDGYVMRDKDDRLLYWFETEEEAKAAAGEDYKVEPARKVYSYSPAPRYNYGSLEDWEGMYEAYDRRIEWENKTAGAVISPAEPEKTGSHAHLFQSRGKRRKKQRGPVIHFEFKTGEWGEVGLRLRNIIGCEPLDVKKEFLNALLYGQVPKPKTEPKPIVPPVSTPTPSTAIPEVGDSKVVVVHGFKQSIPISHFGGDDRIWGDRRYGSGFVQPLKPGRQVIIIPASGAPVGIPAIQTARTEPEEVKEPEQEKTESDPKPPVDKDETAVFQISDVKVRLAEMELDKLEDEWKELKQRYGISAEASGEEILSYVDCGHITADEANELLEVEGNVYKARQDLTVAHIVQKRLTKEAAEVAKAVADQLDGESEPEPELELEQEQEQEQEATDQQEQAELDLQVQEEETIPEPPKREPEFSTNVTGSAGKAAIEAMERLEEERRKYEEGMYYDGFCGGP